ncbi:MAG: prepilin-type N-terminal cleavage/methylation domain-containing protein [Planctomycetaceae bacterium]|nr:prepilin-type N-terminal cleavage/methylation domain-containing protein [Planctomycetaceae bacterium]
MKRPHRHQAHGGFTLLELILVMIILCTVLAMAAPSLKGFFSSRQLNSLAEQIQLLTRYARIQAVSEARYVRVEFDLNRRQYGVTALEGSRYELLKKDFAAWYKMPTDIEFEFENVNIDQGRYVLQFDLRGHTKLCRIRLRDGNDNRIDLVCRTPAENFQLIVLNENDV